MIYINDSLIGQQNILDSIEKSKNCDLASFIFALGIPNVGKKTARDLSKKFKNFEKVNIG